MRLLLLQSPRHFFSRPSLPPYAFPQWRPRLVSAFSVRGPGCLCMWVLGASRRGALLRGVTSTAAGGTPLRILSMRFEPTMAEKTTDALSARSSWAMPKPAWCGPRRGRARAARMSLLFLCYLSRRVHHMGDPTCVSRLLFRLPLAPLPPLLRSRQKSIVLRPTVAEVQSGELCKRELIDLVQVRLRDLVGVVDAIEDVAPFCT